MEINGTEYLPGTGSTSGVLNIPSSSSAWIGFSSGISANGMTGSIAEILVYNSVLSSSQEDAVGYYLSQKYGLTTDYTPPNGSSVWTGTAATSNWADSGNWQNNTVPGLASGTSNTDTATFSLNTATTALNIDSGRNVQNITFDTSAVSSNTIGTTTGNALLLTSGGVIQTTSTVTNAQTVNAPIVLEGAYTFTMRLATSAATLTVGGTVMPDPSLTSSPTLLTLNGSNTGANTISGALADNGAAQLARGGRRPGTSRWVFSGPAKTYTGGTTIGRHATLQLAGATFAVESNDEPSPIPKFTNRRRERKSKCRHGSPALAASVVNSGSLTAYQIRQNSLTINGTSTVTLIPSGSGTNSSSRPRRTTSTSAAMSIFALRSPARPTPGPARSTSATTAW